MIKVVTYLLEANIHANVNVCRLDCSDPYGAPLVYGRAQDRIVKVRHLTTTFISGAVLHVHA